MEIIYDKQGNILEIKVTKSYLSDVKVDGVYLSFRKQREERGKLLGFNSLPIDFLKSPDAEKPFRYFLTDVSLLELKDIMPYSSKTFN